MMSIARLFRDYAIKGRTSLSVKLTLLISIMLFALLGTIGASLWVIRAQRADGLIINLAGRQRMLTQKFTKEFMTELYENIPVGSLSSNTKKLFEVTLRALSNGGQTYLDLGMKKPVDVPATSDQTIRDQLAKVKVLWDELQKAIEEVKYARNNNGDVQTPLRKVYKLNIECLKAMHQAVGLYQSKSESKVNTLMTVQYTAGIISLITFVGILGYIKRRIVSPIVEACAVANAVANGDLNSECRILSNDEIGDLSLALNTMCKNLRDLVSQIKQNADVIATDSSSLSETANMLTEIASDTTSRSSTVAAAAEEMSVNLQNMAGSAEHMAESVKSVAAAIEQMTASINEVSHSTDKSASIAEEATKLAQESNKKLSQLGSAANEIGKVIEVIQDIAEQTNLLALNATIEAARAGEAGKGFAVVANEVKELAKQTAEATEDIARRIQAIQGSASEAVQAIGEISDVIGKVNESASVIKTAVEEQTSTAQEIAHNVSQVASASEVVSANVKESAVAGQEITQNITGVDQSAKKISETAGDTQNAASQLSGVAEKLQNVVSKFKV